MKNLFLTGAVVLAACGAAFGVFYVLNGDAAMHRAAREGDAMAWLRTEFHLNASQFAAVQRLHEDYGAVCAEQCAAIAAARRKAALEKTCVDAMTAHFRRVAALMPAREGERYLATVLPRVAGYQHAAAPTVRATP